MVGAPVVEVGSGAVAAAACVGAGVVGSSDEAIPNVEPAAGAKAAAEARRGTGGARRALGTEPMGTYAGAVADKACVEARGGAPIMCAAAAPAVGGCANGVVGGGTTNGGAAGNIAASKTEE